MEKQTFFSVVVPAHNEENYIDATMQSLVALMYPKDSYEVIVIENGSDDATYEKAKSYESKNIFVQTIPERGVSVARNKGIEKVNPDADWILFLDADTVFSPSFLEELSHYLSSEKAKTYVVGTTTIRPVGDSLLARCWFGYYDYVHQLTKSSCSFFLARKSVLGNTRFDESMTLLEDFNFTTRMRKKGKFFFMHTNGVSTSTRRLFSGGWFRLIWLYAFVGSLPQPLQKRFGYDAVR